MEKIHNNLNIENLVQTDWINQFNKKQQEEIFKGLEKGLDVSIYANKKLTCRKMEIIRCGLEKNLDVSIYANPIYSYKQMSIIREALEKKLNVSVLKNPKLTIEEMEALSVLLEFDWISPDNNEKLVIEKQKTTL